MDADGVAQAAPPVSSPGEEKHWASPTDITNSAEVGRLAASAMERYGRIDALINNAGVGLNKPFMTTTLEEWEHVVSVNLTGTFLCPGSGRPHGTSKVPGSHRQRGLGSGQRGGQGPP